MSSERRQARIAGALYLLVALIAPYGLFVAPARLVVPADAQATALRITAHPGVLHLGMATELALALGGATRVTHARAGAPAAAAA
jgi:hypothetical protein